MPLTQIEPFGINSANSFVFANVTATGNVTAGNVSVAGTVTAAGINTGSSAISTTGNVIGGNILTAGLISATGNVTGTYFIGNGSQLTGIAAGSVDANSLTGTVLNSGVVTSSLTSVGTLTSISVSGTATTATVNAATIGNAGAVHNGTTFSASGTVTAASTVGGVLTAANANVGGTITTTSGNIWNWHGYYFGCSIAILSSSNLSSNVNVSVNSSNVTINTPGAGITLISSNIASVTGNVQAGNLRTIGLVSATGSITGASVVGGIMTGTSLSVSGAVTAASVVGGVITGTSTSVTGNVTGSFFIGNGSQLTGLPASGLKWTTVANTAPVGANAGDFWYNSFNGVKYQYTNDGTSNIWVDQSAPTSFSTITATGNVTGGNVSVAGTVTAASTVGGIITGSSVSVTGTVTGASLEGTITTASQTNITGVGTLTTLTINTGNVAGTSLEVYNVSSNTTAQLGLHATSGAVNRQSKIKFYGTFFNTPGDVGERYVTSIRSGFDSTTTAWGSEFLGVYVNNVSNDSNTDANQTLIGSFTNYQGFTVYKDIRNGQASGTGNIGASGATFNTVFAKATSAQYADLAEMYVADCKYLPGTVVEFGGAFEITQSIESHSTRIAGIVSTNPSYLMNSAQQGEHVLPVALTGRVPCQVIGTIRKGDRVVASSITGVATILDKNLYEPGCIIGKALEDYNSNVVGIIEISVGRY